MSRSSERLRTGPGPGSYSGRFLIVDLGARSVREHRFEPQEVRSLLGARGLGAKLLWDLLPAGTDPLDPANPLIFAPGVLTGTSAPCSGRTTVLAKGPATGHYLKVNVGGHLGIAMKMAGVDGMAVCGASEDPVVIALDRDGVRFESADDVWGQGIHATTERLEQRFGRGCEVACIGPAGERLVRFAAIMTGYHNAAARGGIGAVMGSKKLKALVVDPRGGSVRVADPDAYITAAQRARDLLYADSVAPDLHKFGTARDIDLLNEIRCLPSYNFQHSRLDLDATKISGRSWPELGYLKRIVGCGGCIYSCHRFTSVDEGPYAGVRSGGPEYETVAAFGSGCGLNDPEPVFAANAICNDMGMDTISTGSVIQWAMECVQRGVLSVDQLDGIDLRFGNGPAMVEMVGKIGRREGVGDLLAEGVAVASERVGQGSDAWAVQARGLEQSNVETRGAYGYALAFSVNPRGPDHLHTECLAEFGGTQEGIELVKKLTGDEKLAVPDKEVGRAEIVRWHEDIYAVTDSLGLCAFATTAAYSLSAELLADLARAATGMDVVADDLWNAGRRTLNLERCFNLREGMRPEIDDRLPRRIMEERQEDLTGTGEPIDSERLARMQAEYYALHGWTSKGYPTVDGLTELGLGFIPSRLPAEVQSRMRRVPS